MPTENASLLIVEDEPDVRETLVEYLEDLDYRVRSAGSAEEGWESLRDEPVDLVVCDIRLPGENGLQLMSWARENPSMETIPFVFLTAFDTRDDRLLGKRLGAEDYLAKPVDLEELSTTVENRIGQLARLDRRRRNEVARAEQRAALLSDARDDLARTAEERLRPMATTALGYAEALAAGAVAPVSNQTQQRYLNALSEVLQTLVGRLPEIAILSQTGPTRARDLDTDAERASIQSILNACLQKSPSNLQGAVISRPSDETPYITRIPADRLRRALDHLFGGLSLALQPTTTLRIDVQHSDDETRLSIAGDPLDADQMAAAIGLLEDTRDSAQALISASPTGVGLFAAATVLGLEGGILEAARGNTPDHVEIVLTLPPPEPAGS